MGIILGWMAPLLATDYVLLDILENQGVMAKALTGSLGRFFRAI